MTQQTIQKKRPSQAHIVAASIEAMANVLPHKFNYNTRIKIASNLVLAVHKNNKQLRSKSAIVRNHLLRTAQAVILKADYINTQKINGPTYPSEPKDVNSKSYTNAPQTQRDNSSKTKDNKTSEYLNLQECLDAQISGGMAKEDAISFCQQFDSSPKTIGAPSNASGPLSAAYHSKHLTNEIATYGRELNKPNKTESLAAYQVNVFHPEWREQIDDAKISEMYEARLKQARKDLGLQNAEPPIPICVRRDSIIQQFRERGIVPSDKKVKSGSSTNPMTAYHLRELQFNDGYRNAYLMNQESNKPKIYSASADGMPAWIKVRKHTLSQLGHFQ